MMDEYPVRCEMVELTQEIVVSDPEILETKEVELHISTLQPDGKNFVMIGPERPAMEINRQYFPEMRVTYIANEEVPGLLSRWISVEELPENGVEQMVWLGLILVSQYGGIFGLTTMQFKPHIRGLVSTEPKISVAMISLPGIPRHICPFLYYSPVAHPFFRQYLDDMRREKISLLNPYANTIQWFLQRRTMCQIMDCPTPEFIPFIMT